jgi:hypothetical protein
LANIGLLQGLTSTTTRGNIDYFKRLHPELKIVRDQHVKLKSVGQWDKVISTQGGTDCWDIVRDVRSDLSAAQLMTEVGKIYAAAGKWSIIDPPVAKAAPSSSAWKAVDGDGKSWTVTIRVDDVAGQRKTHLVNRCRSRVESSRCEC